MNVPLPVLTALLTTLGDPLRTAVATPGACETCLFREPEWRDGGWCYYWGDEPPPKCVMFEAGAPAPSHRRQLNRLPGRMG